MQTTADPTASDPIADARPDPESLAAPGGPPAAPATHYFMGRELAPFSPRRQIAAQAMGNRLLSGRARLHEGGAYDGMVADAVALLGLCLASPAAIKRAAVRPEEAVGLSLDWAEDLGIAVGAPAFAEACAVYAAILREIQERQFEIVETGEAGAPRKNGEGGPHTAA
jgi:hypothetical protein